ncbi:scopoletin glucosyltransferase-like [Elaeis guineensis]|uniref:Glycosyltransferase n=1 Tax=Elaeis guineensis var. tenera TaxID=51953 RepID=A0A6I9RRS0_ELAGV|nr:scopoletin glucosyltransferase-like [Elaeis guineensis]
MGLSTQDLHILFLPFMAPGHIIPTVDLAKLFACRGVKATILTTPGNAPSIQPSIDHANDSCSLRHPMALSLLPFPAAEAGIPPGCENLVVTLNNHDIQLKFIKAMELLRQPFARVLRELLPDAVVSDYLLSSTQDVAAELAVPRLVFHGMSLFYLCASHSIDSFKVLESVPPGGAESFVLPSLPHRIEMQRSQIWDLSKMPEMAAFFDRCKNSEERSYGVVANSYYELEPDYAEHYRKVVGRRVWNVGPVSLCNRNEIEKSRRGDETSMDCNQCLSWLNTNKPGSVVYVCFGSMYKLPIAQIREIALGLEASDTPFILVVRGVRGNDADWLPEGFEEEVVGRGKGLIIRGWAPQIVILNHEAVGGFVTHCGWNSCLEGVSAGVPMITWPMFAEQFFNERLIVEVLKVGVGVGVKEFARAGAERRVVAGEEIRRAVGRVMGGGEEAEEMRRRARELAEMARRAVEEGGSSYADVGELIEELIERRKTTGREWMGSAEQV